MQAAGHSEGLVHSPCDPLLLPWLGWGGGGDITSKTAYFRARLCQKYQHDQQYHRCSPRKTYHPLALDTYNAPGSPPLVYCHVGSARRLSWTRVEQCSTKLPLSLSQAQELSLTRSNFPVTAKYTTRQLHIGQTVHSVARTAVRRLVLRWPNWLRVQQCSMQLKTQVEHHWLSSSLKELSHSLLYPSHSSSLSLAVSLLLVVPLTCCFSS